MGCYLWCLSARKRTIGTAPRGRGDDSLNPPPRSIPPRHRRAHHRTQPRTARNTNEHSQHPRGGGDTPGARVLGRTGSGTRKQTDIREQAGRGGGRRNRKSGLRSQGTAPGFRSGCLCLVSGVGRGIRFRSPVWESDFGSRFRWQVSTAGGDVRFPRQASVAGRGSRPRKGLYRCFPGFDDKSRS